VSDGIEVRALSTSDWAALKEIRLRALRTERGLFFSTPEAEQHDTDDQWRERTQNPNRQMFGVFDGARLVGMTGVITARDDPSGETAMFISSYLMPEYRGRGLTRLMYEARLQWVNAQGRYRRVEVSHRRSNEISRRAIRRFGFVHTKSISATWPDGTVDDEVLYELVLPPPA
jgi:RimJ/RimL family protein N-acetyltransferase